MAKSLHSYSGKEKPIGAIELKHVKHLGWCQAYNKHRANVHRYVYHHPHHLYYFTNSLPGKDNGITVVVISPNLHQKEVQPFLRNEAA